MKVLLAIVLSPLAPLLVVVPVLTAFGSIEASGAYALMCIYFGYPATFVVAPGLYYLFRKYGWLRWWQSTGFGALIGATLPLGIVILLAMNSKDLRGAFGSMPGLSSVIQISAVGAGLGSLSALTFWVIALRPLRLKPRGGHVAAQPSVPADGPAAPSGRQARG